MSQPRESLHGQWSSKLAFIMAASGAAVGLGNIWKFPYIAGKNGGGAFVLVYLVCVLLLGIPIMMGEILIGRRGRRNPAQSMALLSEESGHSKKWQWLGTLAILSGFLILSYYSVIAGWAIDYVFHAAKGAFLAKNAAQIDSLFSQMIANPWTLLTYHTLVMLATTVVVAKGVESGLEKAVYVMFPTMLLLILILVGYAIDTGYFAHGLKFLFHPNFSVLTPKAVLMALGHAFFTLSIATGTMMIYGAYVPRHISIVSVSLYIAIVDTLIALLAGLAIFPLVFAHGLEPAAGPGLIFKTLPLAFGAMHFGRVFATLFFLMLVFAAFTSAISLLEPSVAWLMETYHVKRARAAWVCGIAVWLVGLGTVFSFNTAKNWTVFGKTFFTGLDYVTANIFLPLSGLAIAIFCGWLMKKEFLLAELGCDDGLMFACWRITLKIIAPVAVGAVFLYSLGILG